MTKIKNNQLHIKEKELNAKETRKEIRSKNSGYLTSQYNKDYHTTMKFLSILFRNGKLDKFLEKKGFRKPQGFDSEIVLIDDNDIKIEDRRKVESWKDSTKRENQHFRRPKRKKQNANNSGRARK